jgi:hypothetical protein
MREVRALAVTVGLDRESSETEAGMVVADIGGWFLFGSVLFFVIWVAIAFWPARVASRKGHSFFLYFVFSLVFFPLALIVAYMLHDRRAPAVAAG